MQIALALGATIVYRAIEVMSLSRAEFQVHVRPLRLAGSIALAVVCGGCGPDDIASDGGSTAIAVCGDGIQHEDELCDDGNLIPGDGCSPECMPSGMPYDCVDLVVQENIGSSDALMDLLPLADGTFIAAGRIGSGSSMRGWIARFEPSGERRWLVDASTLDPSIRTINGLAGDEQAGIWAMGSAGGSPIQHHLLRFDLDGNLVSSTLAQSEAGEPVEVRDIEVTAAGVWLGGTNRPALVLEMKDAWLGLHDPVQGTIRDLLREDHLGYEDIVKTVARDGEGVVVAATLSTSPQDAAVTKTTIMVARFDEHGIEHERTMVGPSPDPDFARHATRLTRDNSGRWYVGGYLDTFAFNVAHQGHGWLVQVGGSWSWTDVAAPSGMVGVDDGIVVATNPLISTDPNPNEWYFRGWVGEFAWDGTARWEFGGAEDSNPNYEDYTHWVLVRDTLGRFRTAGTAYTTGTDSALRSCLIAR